MKLVFEFFRENYFRTYLKLVFRRQLKKTKLKTRRFIIHKITVRIFRENSFRIYMKLVFKRQIKNKIENPKIHYT